MCPNAREISASVANLNPLAGDSHLIVSLIQIAQFAAGIRGEFAGFSVPAQICHIDRETLDPHG